MAAQETMPCPICSLDNQNVFTGDRGERLFVECDRCGRFPITRAAATVAERKELSPKISCWIRDRNESGTDIPEINTNTLKDIEALLPNYKVSEKQLLLLRALERWTKFPGQSLDVIPDRDYPISWATGRQEFKYLLSNLIERGFIRRTDGGPASLKGSANIALCISAKGWSFLEDHERPSIISDQVFVAMSFSPDLKSAWENGIYPALKRAGYRPYRVDAEPHIDRIDAKIVAEIRNSRFLVADVTQQRPGVYFEAGFAIGLGLPVFWLVRKDDLDNVHFDTRQYNHIIWDSEENLASQLENFVIAFLGKGSSV